MTKLVVGVDVGGTKMAAGAVDAQGNVSALHVVPTQVSAGAAAILAQIVALVQQIAAEKTGQLGLVGVSTGGIVDPGTGTILEATPLLPGWARLALRERLTGILGIPVAVENDAKCAALGEAYHGAGQGLQHFVCLTLGTGVGGALFLNGEIYHGTRGGAGEIGHMVVDYDGRACTCGGQGCLEAYASGPAIVQDYAELTGHHLETLQDVVARVGLNEPDSARAVLELAGAILGHALTGLAHVFDPQQFILGGGVANVDIVVDAARRAFAETARPGFERIPIVRAALGTSAGLVGAAVLAQRLVS